MSLTKTAQPSGVRTVLHISPAVFTAGLLAAQGRGLSLSEFLDDAITHACSRLSKDSGNDQLPLGKHAMELYLQLAETMPDLLTGRWRVLHSRVVADASLWQEPRATLADVEEGVASDGWRIDEQRLRKAWARLVSESFAL